MASPDLEFTASIERVSVSVREKDGVIRRTCEITLAREFDPVIADALGSSAKRVREDVSAGELRKVVIPVDSMILAGTLKTRIGGKGDQVEIPMMRGLTAVAKAGKEEDDPPSVKIDLEFDFSEEAWLFFGRNVSAYAEVTLSRLQQTFAFPPAVAGSDRKTHA
jgi:hypothetical protein